MMSDDLIKDALRMMPYGFYSITSRSGEDVNAMVANWIVQVSFEPRLLMIGLAKKAYSHGLITASRVFTVNLFNKADSDAIQPFTKSRAKNPDKMLHAQFTSSPVVNCPVVTGAAAYLECRVTSVFDPGGDHSLVVGEVVGAAVLKPGEAADTLTLPDLGWSYAG